MKLLLKRQIRTADFTLGELFIDGVSFCQTVEDMERMEGEKVFGKTAIPKGIYKVELTHSLKFGKTMPLIKDVPNFLGIRIHTGNDANASSGCIIIGMTRTLNGVGMSRIAYTKLMDKLTGQTDIEITID